MANATQSQRHRVLRVPPYPLCDVEGMESWLGAMAAQGLHLCGAPGFFGNFFARFERGEPRPTRYRLDSATGNAAANRALAAEFGWRYVAPCGPLAVFACDDAAAPELHTDPQVQALALKATCRGELGEMLFLLAAVVAMPVLRTRGAWLLALLRHGSLYALLVAAYAVCVVVILGGDLLLLRRYARRLAAGYPPNHRTNWRGRNLRRRIAGPLALALVAAQVAVLLAPQPTMPYTGAEPLPVPSLASLYPGSEFVPEGTGGSTLTRRSDPLAPAIIHLEQSGALRQGDTLLWEGTWELDYYETRSPALAAALLREYAREDARLAARHGGATPLPAPSAPGLDEAQAYEALGTVLLLRSGNRLVRVQAIGAAPAAGDWPSAYAAAFAGA